MDMHLSQSINLLHTAKSDPKASQSALHTQEKADCTLQSKQGLIQFTDSLIVHVKLHEAAYI